MKTEKALTEVTRSRRVNKWTCILCKLEDFIAPIVTKRGVIEGKVLRGICEDCNAAVDADCKAVAK